jgi:hypothetical protein
VSLRRLEWCRRGSNGEREGLLQGSAGENLILSCKDVRRAITILSRYLPVSIQHPLPLDNNRIGVQAHSDSCHRGHLRLILCFGIIAPTGAEGIPSLADIFCVDKMSRRWPEVYQCLRRQIGGHVSHHPNWEGSHVVGKELSIRLPLPNISNRTLPDTVSSLVIPAASPPAIHCFNWPASVLLEQPRQLPDGCIRPDRSPLFNLRMSPRGLDCGGLLSGPASEI